MTEFDHNLDGMGDHLEDLEREEEQWSDDEDVWFVGTAVNYSIFLEFGTSKMDPKPFIRPALHAYEANLEAAIAADTQTTLEEISSVDELVKTIAFGLERRIKRIITRKGLIETGTLRASVMAVPDSSAALPSADEVDPTATAEVNV